MINTFPSRWYWYDLSSINKTSISHWGPSTLYCCIWTHPKSIIWCSNIGPICHLHKSSFLSNVYVVSSQITKEKAKINITTKSLLSNTTFINIVFQSTFPSFWGYLSQKPGSSKWFPNLSIHNSRLQLEKLNVAEANLFITVKYDFRFYCCLGYDEIFLKQESST